MCQVRPYQLHIKYEDAITLVNAAIRKKDLLLLYVRMLAVQNLKAKNLAVLLLMKFLIKSRVMLVLLTRNILSSQAMA